MQEVANVLDVLNEFKLKEDGTYEFITHNPVEYSSGYQVSFVRPEAFEHLISEEWDILTTYYGNRLQSEAYIGVYDGSPEVSFHALDYLKAEEVMYECNQESMLDWKEKATFPNDFERWLIINPNFDTEKEVNYNEILERI